MTYTPVLSGTSIIGDDVKNAQGENLGDIKDLMIDLDSGRIEYAVLAFGGFLGLGDKYFAVPWQAMSVNEDDKCFILNVDKETLKAAPGFDKDEWPNFADSSFRDSIYGHYGVRYKRAA